MEIDKKFDNSESSTFFDRVMYLGHT